MPRLGGSGARGEIDWVHVAIAVVLSIAAPPIGLVLSLYWANRRYRVGQPVMVAAMLGAAVIAVAVFLDPMLFWNHLLNL